MTSLLNKFVENAPDLDQPADATAVPPEPISNSHQAADAALVPTEPINKRHQAADAAPVPTEPISNGHQPADAAPVPTEPISNGHQPADAAPVPTEPIDNGDDAERSSSSLERPGGREVAGHAEPLPLQGSDGTQVMACPDEEVFKEPENVKEAFRPIATPNRLILKYLLSPLGRLYSC